MLEINEKIKICVQLQHIPKMSALCDGFANSIFVYFYHIVDAKWRPQF